MEEAKTVTQSKRASFPKLLEFLSSRKYLIGLTEQMLGTVPKDPAVYASFIESKKPAFVVEDESAHVPVLTEDEEADKLEKKGWTGFMTDPEKGLYIFDYMVLGFLKAAAEALGEMIKTTKVSKDGTSITDRLKGLKGKIDRCVFVFPRRIYLDKAEPDGVVERPLRAQTRQGPRVTLARSDAVAAGTKIAFEIKIVPNKDIDFDMIEFLLQYGELSGLGQFRNGSYGRFSVESVEEKAATK
jgi:hypothetical protein